MRSAKWGQILGKSGGTEVATGIMAQARFRRRASANQNDKWASLEP